MVGCVDRCVYVGENRVCVVCVCGKGVLIWCGWVRIECVFVERVCC